MNFLAMDFETANHFPHSACSVALVMVQDNRIVGEYYSLIKPVTEFHWKNIQIHGIQPEDVVNAPKFPEVWQQIQRYFQPQRLIAAHNAQFDNSILRGCLDYYQLPVAHYQSLCTVKTSRRLLPDLRNHRLDTVCQNLDIALLHHHDALEDSRACAKILIRQAQDFGTEPLKKLVTIC